MPLTATQPSLSVEDYLAGEDGAEQRHEYIAGEVYAMTEGNWRGQGQVHDKTSPSKTRNRNAQTSLRLYGRVTVEDAKM